MDVWGELAQELRGTAQVEARKASPPVQRGRITRLDPLEVTLDDDTHLSEEDEDVEFARDLKAVGADVDVGDTVRVHQDGNGDYVISGVIDGGG